MNSKTDHLIGIREIVLKHHLNRLNNLNDEELFKLGLQRKSKSMKFKDLINFYNMKIKHKEVLDKWLKQIY